MKLYKLQLLQALCPDGKRKHVALCNEILDVTDNDNTSHNTLCLVMKLYKLQLLQALCPDANANMWHFLLQAVCPDGKRKHVALCNEILDVTDNDTLRTMLCLVMKLYKLQLLQALLQAVCPDGKRKHVALCNEILDATDNDDTSHNASCLVMKLYKLQLLQALCPDDKRKHVALCNEILDATDNDDTSHNTCLVMKRISMLVVRRRIELIQDFSMPGLSTSVKLSPDNNYILTTGIYKPRVRCYDVNNLSMKFERCFDSEVVTFQVLSDDYSKLVFLQCDRYVEFHSAGGRYFRLRIPKFGRDMRYHLSTCDLYLVGSGSDIYRLNLELGQFLNPFMSEASEINKVAINPVHRLVAVGTREGKVEAWDPRSRGRVGLLDCALSAITPDTNPDMSGFPSVTALEFHGALNLSVGTASGQVLLYDVRSDKPLRVKDHMYGLPIRDIAYCQDHVLSMDSSVIKIWNKDSGTLFTSIEAGNITQFNNLCSVPNSGLMFIANEAPKLLTYYIPSLGPAPKWCGFLDNLTEELEETVMETVYDDYKFVTKNELEDLGLSHLIGTNLLRGYMHGYFIDIRLYRKAKSVAEPFAFEEYRRRKIREKIEEERKNRVQIQCTTNTLKWGLGKARRSSHIEIISTKRSLNRQKSRAKSSFRGRVVVGIIVCVINFIRARST
ncbi:Nucleolar protein 10 [Homalodisca vitripennis]|nr:Nucleolar protein 10 [Homalodisca vitripennis]